MRICFYYEYKNMVGGLTSLFLTLIKELSKQNVDVLLFNYKEGLIARELSKTDVKITIIDIEEFDWNQIDALIFSTDVFIVNGFIEAFHRFFRINPKMILYNVNDYLGDISKYKFGINPKYLAKNLILELIEKDGLVLMDDTGIKNAAEKLGLEIDAPLFLPVPVTVPAENNYLKKQKVNRDIIRLTYIGRSVNWKVFPLKKILDDLGMLNMKDQKKIVFTIVVDNIRNLKKIVDIDKYQAKMSCELILRENLKPSDINAFLLDNSDLNFGMGTSALEGGKLGIPTILMDFSTKDLPNNYQYNWLYNTEFFSLGRNIEKSYFIAVNSLQLKELISELLYNPLYVQSQSSKTFTYVKNHHHVENVVKSLIDYAQKTRFHFLSVKPYNLYYSSFHRQIKRLHKIVDKSF